MSNVFARAAYLLRDYEDVLRASGCDDETSVEQKAECLSLAKELDGLQGEWEGRVGFSDARNAASIVADMLKDWKLPGAVWYLPRLRRFRLVGEGYKASPDETFVGVYTPDATVDMLAEDFDIAIKEAA